jgi:hypothetical protein
MKGIRLVMVSWVISILLAGWSLAQTSKDFIPRNVDFIKMSTGYAKAKGELVNNSGKSLTQAEFVIQVYGKTGNLIGSAPFTVRNFGKGTIRSFNTTVQANVKDIGSYQIEFKAKQVGSTQAGGDFVPKNVDFAKISRTYAKVKGEITNNSGVNLRRADFVIRIYDAAGNLITSASFMVRNFVSGTTREFNTTIRTDIRKISNYEIEFKGGTEIPPSP